jgi:hypothetical protein
MGPFSSPIVLTPTQDPPQLPAGYGCLGVELSRGPYLTPAPLLSRFKVSGAEVPVRMSQGRWFVPVVAGQHLIEVTDLLGPPIMITKVREPAPGDGQIDSPNFTRGLGIRSLRKVIDRITT